MKLLVFGKSGQVGRELSLHPFTVSLGREDADLTDPVKCAEIIAQTDADAVINAAAYTLVDKAEAEEPLAQTINSDAPTAMAMATAARNIPFVHISTDYVFDGSKEGEWLTDDETNPLNAYGRTKLAGEYGVQNAGGVYGILRTSWVFSAHGANFVKSMLRLSQDRTELNIVGDQIGGPTCAKDIADTCIAMAKSLVNSPDKSGLYHYSGYPNVSWAEFANEVFRQSGRDVAVSKIPSTSYPTPAIRPLNSTLDCRGLHQSFGIEQPNWRESLKSVLQELEALKNEKT